MRKTVISFVITLMAVGVFASVSQAGDMTVKGEIIDLPCYEGKNGARGEAHKTCAISCAKRGNQLAIVDDKNTIYVITGDYAANKNEKLVAFVAETVEATGEVTEKDGKKFLAVSAIKKADN
jgi:hypothetical protein